VAKKIQWPNIYNILWERLISHQPPNMEARKIVPLSFASQQRQKFVLSENQPVESPSPLPNYKIHIHFPFIFPFFFKLLKISAPIIFQFVVIDVLTHEFIE
jgi:hypothetical protein